MIHVYSEIMIKKIKNEEGFVEHNIRIKTLILLILLLRKDMCFEEEGVKVMAWPPRVLGFYRFWIWGCGTH